LAKSSGAMFFKGVSATVLALFASLLHSIYNHNHNLLIRLPALSLLQDLIMAFSSCGSHEATSGCRFDKLMVMFD
jgi:hypothetical protein